MVSVWESKYMWTRQRGVAGCLVAVWESTGTGLGKGSWEGLYRIVATRDEVEVAVDEEHVEGEVLDALRLYRSQALSSGRGVFEGGGLRMPLLGLSRRAVVESRVRHARRKDSTPHHIPASGGASVR